MKTAIHLVSMPMASPRLPSIQLSALKTFLARKLGARATVRAHCAYLHVAFGIGLQKYAELSQARSELPMKTLFLRRFLSSQDLSHESAFADEQTLEALEHQITAYLDSHLGPALEPDSINVIGFTVNFHQVYSTLYAVQHLIERNPGRKMLFVFGGGSIAVPQVIALMKKLGIDAFAVLGEGENKLAAIAEACLSIDHFDREVLAKAIRDHRAGVFHVGDAFNLLVREPSWFKGQLESVVSDLDFSDYFQTLEHCFDDKAALLVYLQKTVQVPLEGSRGCVMNCHFCNLNYYWEGYRKKPAARIADEALRVWREHRVKRLHFVDTLADKWITDFVRDPRIQELQPDAFVELRAKQRETFWYELHKAGVRRVLIGLESYSPRLLKLISKGTRVIDNLRAQKYCHELGISISGNIITYYPGSTPEDVNATAKILSACRHFQRVSASPFRLEVGSPAYNALTVEERARLRSKSQAGEYDLNQVLELPERYELTADTRLAWDAFLNWYLEVYKFGARAGDKINLEPRSAAELRMDGEARIFDSRSGTPVTHRLTAEEAALYALCHEGAPIEELVARSGLTASALDRALDSLKANELIVETEGIHLAIALRPHEAVLELWSAKLTSELPANPPANAAHDRLHV